VTCIALEGVYAQSHRRGHTKIRGLRATDQEVCDAVEKIATQTVKFLRNKGYLQEEGAEILRPDLYQLFQDHPGMTETMTNKIAFRKLAGEKVRRVCSGFGYEEETPLVKGTQCATINGFNLHT